MKTLQWGHGESAVENSDAGRDVAAAVSPSMGPRRIRRGKLGSLAQLPETGGLQSGHGDSAVDNARQLGYVDDQFRAFNGATAKPPWKTANRATTSGSSCPPSMGPRRIRRGKRRAMPAQPHRDR